MRDSQSSGSTGIFIPFMYSERKFRTAWVVSTWLLAVGMGAYLSLWIGIRLSVVAATIFILIAILVEVSSRVITNSLKEGD